MLIIYKRKEFRAGFLALGLLTGLLLTGCRGVQGNASSSAVTESVSSGETVRESEENESAAASVMSDSTAADSAASDDAAAESAASDSITADDGKPSGGERAESPAEEGQESLSGSLSGISSSEENESAGTSSGGEVGPLVCIDPGHSNSAGKSGRVPLGPGSSDTKPGDVLGTEGVATHVPEYELTLKVSELLRDELEKRGYRVIMTREENDVTVDLVRRAEIANEAGADIMVRIHANGSDNSSAEGALGICITEHNPFIREQYGESRKLTEDVLNSYCELTSLKNTGIWETDSMATSNWAKMPTTLLELGFMTNPGEDRKMEDPDFQKTMTAGIANGIDHYFQD